MEARGEAGGMLVFWDNWVLKLIEMEVRAYLISCRFKNWEDNFV